jgi:hypothetical protein
MQSSTTLVLPAAFRNISFELSLLRKRLSVKYRKIRTVFLALSWFILSTQNTWAQAPAKLWDKRYGGDDWDVLNSMIRTSDSGYLLGGRTYSGRGGDISEERKGPADYWIVKIDSNGTKQWDKRYGGPGGGELYQMAQTPDGGYLLFGDSSSPVGGDKSQPRRDSLDYGSDFWVVKISSDGTKQWDRTYGGNAEDYFVSMSPTADGGYLLAGSSGSGIGAEKSEASRGGLDYWVVKISSDGTKQWDKTIGGNRIEFVRSILSTSDGGYIITGDSSSGIGGDKSEAKRGSYDVWIVKIDSNGTKQWDKRYGGTGWEVSGEIIPALDGGYLIGGFTGSDKNGDVSEESKGGESDAWLIKIANDGTKQWDKRYGGNDSEGLGSIIPTLDGGYLLGGGSSSNKSGDKSENSRGVSSIGLGSDFWIVKIDLQGNKQWDKTFGGNEGDSFSSVIQEPGGSYVLAGYTESDISWEVSEESRGGSGDYWVLKTTPEPIPSALLAFRLNAGGSAYATPDGRIFAADGYFTGGFSTAPVSGEVANTQADGLYQNSRQGAFSYAFPSNNGTFEVILHFNEPENGTTTGARKFNIDIEGRRQLTGYDIVAKAGRPMKAIQEKFIVQVTDGILNIKFSYGSAGIPLVAAIEVVPVGKSFRVNAGGSTFQASEGRAFSDDAYVSGGFIPAAVSGEVTATEDDSLYINARRGGDFAYHFPTGNGTYTVILHFNESYYGYQAAGGVGSRKFKVFLEGTRVLSEYDIYARAGGAMKAVQERFTTQVTDGVLTVRFVRGSADYALVSAIEVIPATTTARLGIKPVASVTLTQPTLSPNPATDKISLNLGSSGEHVRSIQIMNLVGQVQLQNEYTHSSEQEKVDIPVHQLLPGIYLLKAETEQGTQTFKFIKH